MRLNSIFYKVKVFLRIQKKYTGVHCTPLREIRPFWDFQLFNIEDHNRRSRWVDLYYVFYRFFKYSSWSSPRRAYREVKWFIQRGRRGWADCDVWSLDDYLNSWLPDAVRKLKKDSQGVPGVLVEAEDCDETGSTSEEGMARAVERWDTILEKIALGFEADRRAQSGLYEEELGSYPLDRPAGVSASAWVKVKDDRFAAARELEARDRQTFDEGMALFAKYWHNLWD
jgi:hypothetical protein